MIPFLEAVVAVALMIGFVILLVRLAPSSPSEDISQKISRQKRQQEFKDNCLILGGLGFLVLLFGVAVLVIVFGWNLVTGSGVFYHTERVITDMNMQWLEREQNTCLYEKSPGDETGSLLCNTGNSIHNIPVKFSGTAPSDEDLKKKCVFNGSVFVKVTGFLVVIAN